jgi:oligopeptide/dipeptide ABC transporter ATP-binding protein
MTAGVALDSARLVVVEDLYKSYPRRGILGRSRDQVPAVNGVSLTLARGETLGLVGESGSGKTTVGRAILRLIDPTSGRVSFDGIDLATLSPAGLRRMRRRMQLVFQDPYASLNPRHRVETIVREGLIVHEIARGREAHERVMELLIEVGLTPDHAHRFPHEFSGGQRQRIGIARALAVEPDFLVCDEPVSALDVAVQAQILNLLKDLQRDRGLTYLFIAHDLAVVGYMASRVAVMYRGRIVELGPVQAVYADPVMPYTRALLAAVPRRVGGSPRRHVLLRPERGAAAVVASGCPLYARCPHPARDAACTAIVPPLELKAPDHWAACIKEPARG